MTLVSHRGKAKLRIISDTTQAQRCKLAKRKWDGNNEIEKKNLFWGKNISEN